MHALDFRLLGSWTSVSSMQRDAASRNHLEDYHYGCPEAPHIEAYLWQRIIRLSAELNARRVVDIGCGNGALCRELASRRHEVVGCEPSAKAFSSHEVRRRSWCFTRSE